MKKILLIATFLVAFSGCAFMQKQYDYAKLCANDPACLSEAKKDSDTWKAVAGAAFPIAAYPAGAISMFIALWIRGKKKAKPQVSGTIGKAGNNG